MDGAGRPERTMACFSCALLLLLGALAASSADLEPPPVPALKVYLGQRFAAAPVGPLRFAPAQLAPFNESTFANASANRVGRFGPRCMQGGLVKPKVCTQDGSAQANQCINEDCLFLSIATPKAAVPTAAGGGGGALVPIFFWIYGGGWTAGSGSDYDGDSLAAGQNMMVVTPNYRLGTLGYFASAELQAENAATGGGRGGTGGMNGLLDQITALQWLRKNSHRFGGDASRITIAGESAGGESVCNLLASPAAKGLFKRAIVESGPCVGGQVGWGAHPKTEAFAASAKLAKGRTLAQLRAVADGYSLLQQSGIERRTARAGSSPQGLLRDNNNFDKIEDSVDGFVLVGDMQNPAAPCPTFRSMNSGNLSEWNAEEIIIGGNSFDGLDSYYVPYESFGKPKRLSQAVYTRNMAASYGANAAAVSKLYAPSRFGGNINAAYCQPNGDAGVVCPSLEVAKLLSRAGGKAFVYWFDYGPLCSDQAKAFDATTGAEKIGWASHGSEVTWVFGGSCAAADKSGLSRTMQDLWGSFTRSGAPSSSQTGAWRPWTEVGGETMVLDQKPRMATGIKQKDCAALLAINSSLWAHQT